MNFTPEQVIALAPDGKSVTAAKMLMKPAKWPLLGYDDEAVWGHCQGSGKKAYEVRIDLNGPAFKCSCPSRKFPCKHALALFLLHLEGNGVVPRQTAPLWVSEWIVQRQAVKTEKAQEKKEQAAAPEAIAKKQAKRLKTMLNGIGECERWLCDIVAGGLSEIEGRGYAVWDNAAARLVDAQMPGAAAMVTRMAGIMAAGSADRLARIAVLMGRLYLLLKAVTRFDELSAAQQADVRAAVGWPLEKDAVLSDGQTVQGTWAVVGASIRHNGKMREQRTWLQETVSHAVALILSFSYGNQLPETLLLPGTRIDAELAYYPGSVPLRALIKDQRSEPMPMDATHGRDTIADALGKHAQAVSLNPWIDIYPMVIADVIPLPSDGKLVFRDSDGRHLPVHPRFNALWECVALAGGRGLTIIGEWTDQALLPLACRHDDGYYPFSIEMAV